MSTVIFEEADRHRTKRYKVKGCEKSIIVRSEPVAFILKVETMSLEDAHFRPQPFMTITNAGDYQFPPDAGCGMEVVFRIEEPVDPTMHLFVEVINETCIPEKCCK